MPPVQSRGRGQRRRPATLINKRLVRSFLTKNGKQHAITRSAYLTLAHIGQKMLEKLIMKAKTEIQQTLPLHNRGGPGAASGPSINTNHIKHAANCLHIPAEITEDSIDMSTRQAYDNTAFKRSNVRRLVQNFCGKARVRKDTIPLVWCIIVNLLDEVVMHSILPHQNVLKDGESKNIRIKNEGVYNAIQNHPDKLLDPLKQFVGAGMCLGA